MTSNGQCYRIGGHTERVGDNILDQDIERLAVWFQSNLACRNDVVHITTSKQRGPIGKVDCLILRHGGNEASYWKCLLHGAPFRPGELMVPPGTKTNLEKHERVWMWLRQRC
jgi:hypothetical protein